MLATLALALAVVAPVAAHEATGGTPGLVQGPGHCRTTAAGRTICRHRDRLIHAGPGAARHDRSLRALVRAAGGRAALAPFRSAEPGAVIDVEATGLGGMAGPADLPGGGAPSIAGAAEGTPGILCSGNGTSGPRVQAVYAWSSQDRSAEVVPLVRRWAADVAATVRVSAGLAGGRLSVRWVTTPSCVLSVLVVRVPTRVLGNEAAFERALAAKGLRRADRRYLVWNDANRLCGIGSMYLDDSRRYNWNDGYAPAWARIDRGCWGLMSDPQQGHSVEAHELFHTLGAVQLSAPHSTLAGHCFDESDVMCYADGGRRGRMRQVCSTGREAWLDCRNDDYFAPRARRGTYLARHWNTARSSFLSREDGAAPVLHGLSLEGPTTGLDEPSSPVTVRARLIADGGLDHLEMDAVIDGEGDPVPLSATGGTAAAPVVQLERGHDYRVRVTAVDAAGRRSVTLAADLSLPIDHPPTIARATAEILEPHGATVDVLLWWSADDDGEIVGSEHQVRQDGAAYGPVVASDQTTAVLFEDIARSRTLRYRVRVRDDAGQWSAWAETDDLVIPADAPPSVGRPTAVVTADVGDGMVEARVAWTTEDDNPPVERADVYATIDGGEEQLYSWWVDSPVDLLLYGGHAYVFRIRVQDSGGHVAWSVASAPLVVP